MKLDLSDLAPAEASFTLSERPGKTYTLKKFSLAATAWVQNRFGAENIQGIFKDQNLPKIAEIVHYLLKDKTDFPTVESFMEAVVTQADRIALFQVLFESVGLSQPVMDKIAKETHPKKHQAPADQPTGE